MKFEFKGSFVQVTAETTDENFVLLEATKQVKVATTKLPKPQTKRKGYRLSKEENLAKKKNMNLLKDQLTQITPGSTGFIPYETAKTSRSFPSYVHYIVTKRTGHKASISKVFGGYQVAVLK